MTNPDGALQWLRQWAARAELRGAAQEDLEAAATFDSLDRWLSHGGAWPHDWEYETKSTR